MKLICAAALILLQAGAARAANDAFELFEEEARVVTASRRSEFIHEAPVAVEVVTGEEIRKSGAVDIWDYMRFRAGMNVVDGRSGEGNRALVSIRGFPAEFVDNMLVLLDGRSVYTGLSGGAVWEALPVQAQDIERIEIIRGPNAALYGSNAGLGVVNIITRKPAARRTLTGETVGGNEGLHREQASYEDGGKSAAYRLSFAHKERRGFPTTAGAIGQDFLYSNKGNARAFWTPTDRSTLELLTGGSWDNLGVIDADNPTARFRHHFEMLKHSYVPDPDSSVQTMLARRDDVRTYETRAGGLIAVREYQYDVEVSHGLDWMDGQQHTVYGGSFRYTGIESAQLFSSHPYQKNAVQRGFASQTWRVLPRLNLIGALSIEHSDTGGVEPAYQFAAVANPWRNHTFRASYGLAPTTPTLYTRAARQQASPTVLLVGSPQIKPQRLRSHEVSYQGLLLDKRLKVETNLFYMDIDRLSRTVVQSYNFPLLTLSFDNENAAIARGAEVKWSWRWDAERSIYANYTYESISDAKAVVNARKGTPPHKVNLGGTTSLGRGLSLGLNTGYQDGHTLYSRTTNQTLDIPAYWRVDAKLAYRPAPDWELFIAGQNLARAQHVEFADGLTVPRTYQAGVSVRLAR